jgi:transcriptional regulator with PAS, ATPase and Fis domain
MLHLLDTARQVGPTDCNVLVAGESGTGKELLARYVHTHSGRADSRFVAVNCGALQEELIANELFGHEKGAFTGADRIKRGLIEIAEGGTLFLDEITEMSPVMQVKLLRVLQERELLRVGGTEAVAIDVRFIAATNRDLQESVTNGRFRADLFFRLNVVNLTLPPLRERRDDVPLLAFYFLKKFAQAMGKPVADLAQDALRLLNRYDYPGNVRELANLIERGVALAQGTTLELAHLPESLRSLTVRIATPVKS